MGDIDFIIVGGGSAGCVLANRLSAKENFRVLLIEAGPKDTHPHIHIPGAYPKIHRSNLDWGFWTEPQQHVFNRKIYLPRGKTLGGSSSTNAMAYVRGNKEDYNHWSDLGNVGWSYDEVLPYFIKSEFNAQIDLLDQSFHGTQGELHVSYANYFQSPLGRAFIDAAQAAGLPQGNDYNGAIQNATAPFQFTIKDGKRHSAATAFLKPIKSRKNLTILPNSQISEIILEDQRAVGVKLYRSNGNHQIIKAKREVILSAGAFHSPQLLMLSGIGDPDELKAHKVDCKVDLPGGGKNLKDHLFYFICLFC